MKQRDKEKAESAKVAAPTEVSEALTPDEARAVPAAPSGGKKGWLIAVLLVLLLAAGGAAGYFYLKDPKGFREFFHLEGP
jgi:uncharacterized protein HemX